MSSETNSYAFCADYSSMASCLFAIQAAYDSGAYDNDPTLTQMIRVFQNGVIQVLLNRTLTVLGNLDGIDLNGTYLPGDFTSLDFYFKDFNDGYLLADFNSDYSSTDYNTGYLDLTNTGFSSTFQTILNIFGAFIQNISEITSAEITQLDSALVDVINAFNTLQAYLTAHGENPCQPAAAVNYNNSPDIYIQAAGADGSDGVPEGIHLRWTFAGDLALNHLAKGTYDNATGVTSNYNQPNDFIKVTRTPYINTVRVSVDLQNFQPAINYAARQWTYIINQTANNTAIRNLITLTFTDFAAYDQLAVSTDPTVHYYDFLNAYPEIIQFQVSGKSLFLISLDLGNSSGSNSATCKIEAVCSPDPTGINVPFDYARQTTVVPGGGGLTETIFAENIQTVNIKKTLNSLLQNFQFETYSDFFSTRSNTDWSVVGNIFSLSVNDQQIFDQLETPAYPVDDLWPQYNDGTTVRIANYHDRWSATYPDQPSLKDTINQYFLLSETDPRANTVLASEDIYPDTPGLTISYVDVLNFLAADYHMARMLGLGFIDVNSGGGTDDQFIYRMAYINATSLTDQTPLSRSYLTLPASIAQNLLPEQPQMRPVTYGIPSDNSAVPSGFDANGYSLYGDFRAVNIGREPFDDEIDGYDFFADLSQINNTNVFVNTRPVTYGVDYRPAGQSNYLKPGITSPAPADIRYYAYDTDVPSTGIPEVVPVLDDDTSLYIHFEYHTGVHFYAIYGINWFSRASVLSAEVSTDATAFPPVNRLQVPAGVAVQYIQEEDTLIFTTATEQAWLAGRTASFPGQDVNFTRVVFSWIDIVDISALSDTTAEQLGTIIKVDKVNVFFDPNLPLQVTGIIQQISAVPGSDTQLSLVIGPYIQIDGTSITPAINADDFFRFSNSLLNTENGQYQVVSISAGTPWPVIIIEQVAETAAVEDPQQAGSYGLTTTYTSPITGSRFTIVENLSNPANWDTVSEGFEIVSFADINNPVIESSTDSEGNVSSNWIGGISANAAVTALFSDANLDTDMPGYYRIDFDGTVLNPHPQINLPFDPANPGNNPPSSVHEAHVEWYQGWLRINRASGDPDKKLLQVLRIEQTDPLVLYIYDATYQTDPITVSTTDTPELPVNFHPGYRCYLFTEPAPLFLNGPNILPTAVQVSKNTLIGLQSADTSGGSGFTSPVSSPAVLSARYIQVPVQLDPPSLSGSKVRPDAAQKASLTFDVTIAPAADGSASNPFGFQFSRISDEDVLNVLYEPATITQILADEAALTADPNHDERYYELVNLIFDPNNPGSFRVFDATPQPYGFPVPDKSGLTSTGQSLEVMIQEYTAAIQGAILPLNLQIPVYQFIKTGLQTSNSLPVIRDQYGNLLDPADPAFDPFPMITKYTIPADVNTTYIRFTDYTLSGSSRRQYFYTVAEVTNQLVAGPLSLFAGPVTILNTNPPDAPILETFSLVPPSVTSNYPLSVVFQLSPMAPYDNITAMRFYRATDISLTGSLLTMTASPDIPVGTESLAGFTLTDDFWDMTSVPFGGQLFYRIVAIRVIINEFNMPEEVISTASDLITVNLIDTINPVAPQLAYTASSNTLSWMPATYNGTYYLYQQNSRGNWTLIYTAAMMPAGTQINYELPAPLAMIDGNGNPIYNRFKVKVQNASGLLNLADNELTVNPNT